MPKSTSSFRISSQEFEPAYMELFQSGELFRRSRQALRHLENCKGCPRDCEVNRLENEKAVCKTGRYATVGSYGPHFGEGRYQETEAAIIYLLNKKHPASSG